MGKNKQTTPKQIGINYYLNNICNLLKLPKNTEIYCIMNMEATT